MFAMLAGASMPQDWRNAFAVIGAALARPKGGPRLMQSAVAATIPRALVMPMLCALVLLHASRAAAIDFYEIEIYTVDTTPKGQLQLELHSNTVTTATGQWARQAINPYQIHETLEATYGLLDHVEVGQYLASARLNNGYYEYSGSRTKMHFGVGPTESWPIQLGGNIELDYMRHAAEENPLNLELRPILESHYGKFDIVANLAFEKPFSGPTTHQGMQFDPSGEILYNGLFGSFSPALEYYGDMGSIQPLASIQKQQHFLVPALNLDIDPRLEVNLGIGFGLTRTSNGTFIKSIFGWTF
jgi:hypothetical protein